MRSRKWVAGCVRSSALTELTQEIKPRESATSTWRHSTGLPIPQRAPSRTRLMALKAFNCDRTSRHWLAGLFADCKYLTDRLLHALMRWPTAEGVNDRCSAAASKLPYSITAAKRCQLMSGARRSILSK